MNYEYDLIHLPTGNDYPPNSGFKDYNWWKNEAYKIGNIGVLTDDAAKRLRTYEGKLWQITKDDPPGSPSDCRLAHTSSVHAMKTFGELSSRVNQLTEILQSTRILASLERFAGWFSLFLHSQNIRWVVMDFSLPLILGFIAIVLLIWKL